MSKMMITNFKRNATIAANKAESTITEANNLLGIPYDVALVNNLRNSINNLDSSKQKMDSFETEIQSIINEEPTLADEKKQSLEKGLRDHLESIEFPKLYEQIAEATDKLQQKLDAGDAACCGGTPAPTLSGDTRQDADDSSQEQHRGNDGNNERQAGNQGPQQHDTNIQERFTKIENTLSNLMSLVQGLADDACCARGTPSPRGTNASSNQRTSPTSSGSEQASQPPFLPVNTQPTGFAPGFNPRFHSGFNQGFNMPHPNNSYYQNNQLAALQQQVVPVANFESAINMEQMKAAFVSSVMSTLKPFSGEACDYANFMAQFNSMVHSNPYIDAQVKQTLLTNLLPSALAREHQTTVVSEEKYNMIRQNLERQFNRQNSQYSILWRNLQDIKFPDDDMAKLKSALNTYSTIAFKLQDAELNPNDKFFVNTMVDKLPYKLRRAGQKMINQGGVSLKAMMNKIYEIIANEEGLTRTSPKLSLGYDENYVNNVSINSVSYGQNQHRQYSANTRGGKVRRHFVPPSKEIPCRYCDEKDHCAAECKIPYEKKRDAVQKKVLCYNCLSEKHGAVDCRSRFSCINCQKKHFTGHCPQLRNKANVSINVLEYIDVEDDEELEAQEKQLFHGPGAETPEH